MSDDDELPIVTRKQWGAKKSARRMPKLVAPVNIYAITYILPVDRCFSDRQCIPKVQELQRKHMEIGCADIKYNFLIGSSGSIYEGRGLKYQPDKWIPFHEHRGDRIDVAFLGDYSSDDVRSSDVGFDLMYDLQMYLVANDYLTTKWEVRHIDTPQT